MLIDLYKNNVPIKVLSNWPTYKTLLWKTLHVRGHTIHGLNFIYLQIKNILFGRHFSETLKLQLAP